MERNVVITKKGKWTQEQISAVIGYNRTTVTHSCTAVKNMLEARQSEHMEYVDLGCKLGVLKKV